MNKYSQKTVPKGCGNLYSLEHYVYFLIILATYEGCQPASSKVVWLLLELAFSEPQGGSSSPGPLVRVHLTPKLFAVEFSCLEQKRCKRNSRETHEGLGTMTNTGLRALSAGMGKLIHSIIPSTSSEPFRKTGLCFSFLRFHNSIFKLMF